jgi:hypothetical protein
MKNRTLFTALLVAMAVFPSIASPLTVPSIAQAQVISGFCFNNNLGIELPISPSDAAALANSLTSQGFWTTGTPINSYTESVASAVVGFQQKYATAILAPNGLLYGTGYVGPSTRAELNMLSGCSPSSTPGQPAQCPTGFTCTPINQGASITCPMGWTCTPMTNPTNPISPANPSPTLGTGAYFSIPTMPSIEKQNGSAGTSSNYATYTASFNVQVVTVGTDAVIGLPQASLPFVIPNIALIGIFKNSTDINGQEEQLSAYNPTVSYSQPNNTSLSADGNSFTVGPNQTVSIPVTVSFSVQNPGSNVYAVALRAVDWALNGQTKYTPLGGQAGLMTTPI